MGILRVKVIIFVPMSLKMSKIIMSVRSLMGGFSLRGYIKGYSSISRGWESAIERARSMW